MSNCCVFPAIAVPAANTPQLNSLESTTGERRVEEEGKRIIRRSQTALESAAHYHTDPTTGRQPGLRTSLREKYADSHRWETHPWRMMNRASGLDSEADRRTADEEVGRTYVRNRTLRIAVQDPKRSEFIARYENLRSAPSPIHESELHYGDGEITTNRFEHHDDDDDRHHHEHLPVIRQEERFLSSFAIRPPSDDLELDWTGWDDDSPSSTSNASMTLSPTRLFMADNLLSIESSMATSDSNGGSEDSVLNPTTAAEIADLACPVPDESVVVDKYGFIVRDGEDKSTTNIDHVDPVKAKTRLKKWRRMVGAGGVDWQNYLNKHPAKVKRRIRKGIPDALRGLVWQLLSGGRSLLLQNEGLYQQLMLYETGMEKIELEIVRDLNRTYPSHVYFQQRQGPGQRSLFNVLKAYSIYNTKVGYVQGMGFVAGLLLLYMCEEDAFWTLVALMTRAVQPPMEGLYTDGFPLVQQHFAHFERLIKNDLPKLSEHFEKECVHPSMFCFNWFNTVFAYSLPFEHLVRVWDAFLFEGWKIVYRVGLVLLRSAEDQLLQHSLEGILGHLSSNSKQLSPEQYPALAKSPDFFIKTASNIRVSKTLYKKQRKTG